jgi:hypothetical protein
MAQYLDSLSNSSEARATAAARAKPRGAAKTTRKK